MVHFRGFTLLRVLSGAGSGRCLSGSEVEMFCGRRADFIFWGEVMLRGEAAPGPPLCGGEFLVFCFYFVFLCFLFVYFCVFVCFFIVFFCFFSLSFFPFLVIYLFCNRLYRYLIYYTFFLC